MSTGPAEPHASDTAAPSPPPVPYGPPADWAGPTRQDYLDQYRRLQQPGSDAAPATDAPGYLGPITDGWAPVSLILSVASLVLALRYGVGLLGSPVALGLARVSLRRIDRSGGRLGGRRSARAGFVLGVGGTVLLVSAVAVLTTFVVLGATGVVGGADPP